MAAEKALACEPSSKSALRPVLFILEADIAAPLEISAFLIEPFLILAPSTALLAIFGRLTALLPICRFLMAFLAISR